MSLNLLRRGVIAALPLTLSACSWFTDFKQQPSVGTWQQFSADSGEIKPFRANPQGSVNTNGTLVAGFAVSYQPLPQVIDSMAGIANPTAPDARSLLNGRKYYSINCAVCHGSLGDGNGTLAQLNPAYRFAPSLIGDGTKARTDGYIWGMMRNGRGLMPSANRIEEMERWDVVNYVRGLQGKYPVDTGAVGRPGETGDKLPGYTHLGPTVPSRYSHPVLNVRPAKGEHEKPTEKGAEAAAKPEGK